jgi:hypothetical protein
MSPDFTYNYFNGDKFIANQVLELKNKFNINVAIETGTAIGDTTLWLSRNFKEVHTFEISEKFYKTAKDNCKGNNNVNFYLGSSINLLENVINDINERCLFFLDAHWGKSCPTPIELDIISKCKHTPVIVIHDFLNPNNRNLGFDSYKDFVYKWDNIKDKIDKIYNGKYEYFYNTEHEGANVGVIYIIPFE